MTRANKVMLIAFIVAAVGSGYFENVRDFDRYVVSALVGIFVSLYFSAQARDEEKAVTDAVINRLLERVAALEKDVVALKASQDDLYTRSSLND